MKIGNIIVPKKRYARSNLRPVVMIVGNGDAIDATIEIGGYRGSYKVLYEEHIDLWTVYYCERFYEVLR